MEILNYVTRNLFQLGTPVRISGLRDIALSDAGIEERFRRTPSHTHTHAQFVSRAPGAAYAQAIVIIPNQKTSVRVADVMTDSLRPRQFHFHFLPSTLQETTTRNSAMENRPFYVILFRGVIRQENDQNI